MKYTFPIQNIVPELNTPSKVKNLWWLWHKKKKNQKKNKHGQISTIYLGNINPTQNIYLELHLLGENNCSYSPQISLLKCSTVFSNRPTMLLMIE